MITKKTVLILGAGASAHLEYPLGKQLVDEILSAGGTAFWNLLEPHFKRSDAEKFQEFLRFSDCSSIDEFLRTHEHRAKLGKFLIAHILKQKESLERPFHPKDSGWYRHLFDSMLVDGKPDFDKNAISIITFNYDRSLEAYIHHVLKHRFEKTEDEATKLLKMIQIIHVHGILGEYPKTPYRPSTNSAETLAVSELIQTVHDFPDNPHVFSNDQFKLAHTKIAEAERILFLGFGFHPENLKRFKYFASENAADLKQKEIVSTFSDNNSVSRHRLLDRLARENGLGSIVLPPVPTDCEGFFTTQTILL
jgi:hypothetical protein